MTAVVRLPEVKNNNKTSAIPKDLFLSENSRLGSIDESSQLLPNKLNKNSSTYGLHQSILNGRLKQVKYFLKMGLKVNSKDKYGRTCLMLATLCDHEDYGLQATKLLLNFGADINVTDTLGRTCLYMAISQKRDKLFNYLIDTHSALIDFRMKDNDGNILLNHAAVHGSLKVVKKIIEKMKERYIDLDQRNKSGYTALLLAIKNDKFLTAYTLIKEAQTSPALRDNEKYLNAIEWLSNRINANRDLILNTNLTNKNIKELTLTQLNLNSMSQSNLTAVNTYSVASSSSSSEESVSNGTPSIGGSFSSTNRQLIRNPKIGGSFRVKKHPSTQHLNYKTWYTSSNPYFENNSSCDHTDNPNFSVEHNKSRFIPLILTPRNFGFKFGINFNDSKSYGLKNEVVGDILESNENLNIDDLDEKSTLKEIVEKLYEAIYYKMSEATSIKSVNNNSLEKLEAEQKLNEALNKKKNNRKVSNAKAIGAAASRKLSVINKETIGEKLDPAEQQQQRPEKTLNLDAANIFDLEAMRQTPKLLALQPLRPRISVKESMHTIFDMYDSVSVMRQDLFGLSESVKVKRSRSTILNKEKSNLSQGSAKNANNRVKFNME